MRLPRTSAARRRQGVAEVGTTRCRSLARCQAGFERLQLLEAYGGLVQVSMYRRSDVRSVRAAGSAVAAALTDLDQIVVALVTEHTSHWKSRSSPAPDVRLIPHRRRHQPMRSARDTMIPSGPRT